MVGHGEGAGQDYQGGGGVMLAGILFIVSLNLLALVAIDKRLQDILDELRGRDDMDD